MNNKIKYYPNGNKKKEILPLIKSGFDFKLVIKYNPEGNIFSVMEKPNLKTLDPCILASGAHVLTNPLENHIDFFLSGTLISKEYPLVRGSNNYGYTISGANLIV